MRPFPFVLRILLIAALAFGVWRQCFAEAPDQLDLDTSAESAGTVEEPSSEARRARKSAGSSAATPPAKLLPATMGSGVIALGDSSTRDYTVIARDGRGLPIEGAQVRVNGGVAPPLHYRTDAKGAVSLPFTSQRTQIIELRSGELGCRHILRERPLNPVILELVPSLDFAVRLRSLEGKPLCGLRVFLREQDVDPAAAEMGLRQSGPYFPQSKEPIQTTDAQGVARFLVGRDVWDFAPGSVLDIVVDFVNGKETVRRVTVEELQKGTIEMTLAVPATSVFQVASRTATEVIVSWMLGGDLIDLVRAEDHRRLGAGESFAIHAEAAVSDLRADFVVRARGRETVRYPLVPLRFARSRPQTLALGPALAILSFQVRDRRGQPVSGVDFEALPPRGFDPHETALVEGRRAFDRARRRVRSDAEGRVVMEMPASWGRPLLRARVGQLRLPAELPMLAAGESQDLGELLFEPGPLAVSGLVRDVRGQPVVGARARILSRDSYRDWSTRTDENGRFRIEAPLKVDDGKPIRLAIFAEGYLDGRPQDVYFGTRDLRVTLDVAAGCRGTIDFGNPILRREMTTEVIDVETGAVHTMVVPNLDGTFITRRLPAGRCALRVRWNRDHENKITETFPFEVSPGEIVDLGLMKVARGYERSFIRIARADGKPDPYASFVLREEGGEFVIRDSMMPLSELPLNLPTGRTWSIEITSIDQGSLKKSGLRPPFILRLPGEKKNDKN